MCNSAVIGWNVLKMSMRSCWWFFSSISLLIFCLVLSLVEKGILTSSALSVDLFIAPLRPGTCYYIYFAALLFGTRTFRIAGEGHLLPGDSRILNPSLDIQ